MDRRKFLIAAGGTAIGTSALVGSGAFSAATVERDVDIAVVSDENGLLGLRAGDTDLVNVGDDSGELSISFDLDNGGDGVNPDSTYQVGAIGDKAAGGIESYVENASTQPDPQVTTSDILYGEAVGDSETTPDDPAFCVMNQTNTDHNVEVFYEGPDVNDATVLMAGAGPTNDGAAAFEIHPSDDDNSGRLGGFPIKAGNDFCISLLVKVGDVNDIDNVGSFNGQLIFQAGEAEGDYSS
jgi:hypothetical protein